MGLCLLVINRLRACAVDHFRTAIFSIRNELFDYAAEGNIRFDHPAYGMLRSITNGFVRVAHTVHLTRFAYLVLIESRTVAPGAEQFETDWRTALDSLPEPARDQMNAYRLEVHRALGTYLLYGSPVLLLVLIVPATAVGVIFRVGKRALVDTVVRRFSRPLSGADIQALDVGEDDDLAFATT